MIHKIDLGPASHHGPFGNPAPLGLLGLAIACAAFVPSTLGLSLDPMGLKTAAVFAILFGCGCQLLAGLMEFANKNSFGGTIFTCFSFLWAKNAWVFISFSKGQIPDHNIGLTVDILLFVIFCVLTYGFGFFSKIMFLFLFVIDLLYVCLIIKGVTHTAFLNPVVAGLNMAMGGIGLWIALAALINPLCGKNLFYIPGPMFALQKKARFDWRMRRAIFDCLYQHFRERAYQEISLKELETAVFQKIRGKALLADLFYLSEFGYLKLTIDPQDSGHIHSLRLNAQGIDLYEQLVLKKYDFQA